MADDAALLAALQLRLQGGAGPLPKLEYVAAALAMARDQIAPVFALANVPPGGSRTRVLQWRDRILREKVWLQLVRRPPLPSQQLRLAAFAAWNVNLLYARMHGSATYVEPT